MESIVSQLMSRGQGHEFVNKLEAAGLNDRLAQKIIDAKGNDLAMKVVRLIVNGGFEPTTSQKSARAVMGTNFFGIEEAIRHFGVNPNRKQLAALAEVPYTEATLTECKDTHVLVAVFPLSTLDIRGKVECTLFYGHEGAWYNKQAFAKDKGDIGWHLVRKTPVTDSTSKTWGEQQALLVANEYTPPVQVMTYTIIGHFLATGERLFENIYIRCSDLDSDGRRVSVGGFDADGLYVYNYWGDDRDDYVGVSAARKFD